MLVVVCPVLCGSLPVVVCRGLLLHVVICCLLLLQFVLFL